MLALFFIVPRTRDTLDIFNLAAMAAAATVLGVFFCPRRAQNRTVHAGLAVVYLQLPRPSQSQPKCSDMP
jgi:hypothetical protein